MSHNLWRFFLEDDVESFRHYLATATLSAAPRATVGSLHTGNALRVGSPGSLAHSPKTPLKGRKSSGHVPTSAGSSKHTGVVLTRAEINAKDGFGRTILHHAASSTSENALEFVKILLEIPFLDIYAQDAESGWTALHRALYCGNISIAHALMVRDIQAAIEFSKTTSFAHAGGLVKIKDNEGNSPFEVFGLTIAPRTLDYDHTTIAPTAQDDDSVNDIDTAEDKILENTKRHLSQSIDLSGDEAFAFGSNKNLSLGLGDEDDRHFPERIQLTRPEQLLERLYEDHASSNENATMTEDFVASVGNLRLQGGIPATVRHQPITIQNIVMAKLHTAILTTDIVSNLYICGFGAGGRLGTGDENTCFSYRCIQAGGLAKRHIATVALGQDHTIAVCSQGEVYTWGSNRYGQLGYALPEVPKNEIPTQLTPRQLYGYIKKESIIGAAASSIHSVLYAPNALYTFGKNEGQLGLMDADARSLEIQITPRRIGASLIYTPIHSVSAIDRATIVLLDNHDVIVFTHYGYTRVVFPLETFTNFYMAEHLSLRYNHELNYIKQVSGGGNTICAMSSYGEVFTVEVPKVLETVPSGTSTTNPTKARNALPPPTRLWSIRKAHMSATDVAVGQDGSVILCTQSGSVWRKEKRANIKSVRDKLKGSARPKDYKFVRIPHLTQTKAVRSNAFGAFTAVRKDSTVTREQIIPAASHLWTDIFTLLPFSKYGLSGTENAIDNDAARISRAIATNPDAESDILHLCQRYEPLSDSQYDLWITSNVTDVRIPVHSFILKARSRVLRAALTEFQGAYYYSIADIMSIEYGQDGDVRILFSGAEFLTLVNFVLYLYTENIVDVGPYTSRSVRQELMKIANQLEMPHLERAVRVMTDPARCLNMDMESAILDPDFYSDSDVTIELADGAELPAHSTFLCVRCPFFNGLFNGRAGGRWMTSRRDAAEAQSETVRVNFKHLDERIFSLVLRHLYADTGENLFENIATSSLDEFIDIVLELMSAANELMLDRLAQICQQVVGKYVNIRNVCSLVNVIAECSVEDFKHAALEYICLNLEIMLELKLLDELDEDLLSQLNDIVQSNQLAFSPFSRSGRDEQVLLEEHPNLFAEIEVNKQRRIDSMRLRSRLIEDEDRFASTKPRVGSFERAAFSPSMKGHPLTPTGDSPVMTPSPSPAILAMDDTDDLPFDMDDVQSNVLPDAASRAVDLATPLMSSTHASMVPERSVEPGAPFQDLKQRRKGDLTGFGLQSSAQNSAIPASSPRAAWHASGPNMQKIDLKNIMEQDSASRVSNLTQAMRNMSTSSKSTSKVSQKERKRQQQQVRQQEVKDTHVGQVAISAGLGPPSSPWQTVASPNKSQNPLGQSSSHGTSETPGAVKPAMTMRQTVAGSASRPTPAVSQSNQEARTARPAVPSKAAVPQIQSIRHSPVVSRMPSSVDARTSMSEILAQQQTEKRAVKEAVAKRSLQEIQQEQEFQQWWDNESKRVQEEEAQTAAGSARRGRGSGANFGSRRGGGKGKSAKSTTTTTTQVTRGDGASHGSPSSRGAVKPSEAAGGGPTRGQRGSERGRARGRPGGERRSTGTL